MIRIHDRLREGEEGGPPPGGEETTTTKPQLGGLATATPPDGGDKDWRTLLPEDLRDTGTVRDLKAATVSDALVEMSRQAINAQSMIGGDRIPVLKEDATPEERLAWRQAHFGTPKDIEGYAVPDLEKMELQNEIPLEDDRVKAFKEFALNELNAAPQDFEKIMGFYLKMVDGDMTAFKESQQARSAEQLQALQEEWGETRFETNMKVANLAAEKLGGEPLIKALEEAGLLNNPEVIKAFHQAGQYVLDDVLTKGGPDSTKNLDPQVVGARKLEQLQNDTEFMKLLHSRNPDEQEAHDKAVNEWAVAVAQATYGDDWREALQNP
jgi:hypothetical protein